MSMCYTSVRCIIYTAVHFPSSYGVPRASGMAQARPPITPISHGRRHERNESVQAVRGDLMVPRGHNMPTPLTRFIGREREVATIGALLETNRLLTLTGSGGC